MNMSLFNVFDTAGTGMYAQSVRLNTTSSNLANANSASSSIDQTYRARQPVFGQILKDPYASDGTAVGVRVLGVVESKTPLRREYNPGNPNADDEGYVYMPNVNVVEEVIRRRP